MFILTLWGRYPENICTSALNDSADAQLWMPEHIWIHGETQTQTRCGPKRAEGSNQPAA